jgi:hypothetical protein
MPDKFEREIEEILAKLDDQLPPDKGAERSPISIAQRRQQKARARKVSNPRANPLAGLTPTTLLFTGAGVMFAGLIISNFWGPAIWLSFAGIVMFIGAFLWSFRRTNRPAAGPSAGGGHYWRDRYIDDSQRAAGVKGWFRKR